MSWEWSHTDEAYRAVETNIRNKPREWLAVVFAEWRAAQGKRGEIVRGSDNFNEKKYEKALKYANDPTKITTEQLAEFVWEKTNELRRCENGGHHAHCCPFGCMTHFVPFHIEQADSEGGEID